MKIFVRLLLCLFLGLFLSVNANAGLNTYYCAQKGAYINLGDSPTQVEMACGKPASQSTRREATTKVVPVQQWFYYHDRINITQTGEHPDPGEQAPNILIFENGKLREIHSAGLKLTASGFCPSIQPIRVGDTVLTVRTRCGAPSQVQEGEQTITTGSTNVTTWVYDNGPYQPKTTLEFKGGKLTSINVGSS